MSEEFLLQLIQKTLHELDYTSTADALSLEIRRRRLIETDKPEESTQIQAINWFFSQLKDGRYAGVDSFLLALLSADNTASIFGSLINEPENPSPDAMLGFLGALAECNDPKNMIMTILYLNRRIYFLNELGSGTDSNVLLKLLRDKLMPILDALSFEECGAIFGDLCSKLNREDESNILSNLIFETSSILTPEILLVDADSLEKLPRMYFSSVFKLDDKSKMFKTEYNIPPGYMKTLIGQSLAFQKSQHPSYLIPRTKAEEKKIDHDEEDESMLRSNPKQVHEHLGATLPNDLLHSLNHHSSQVWHAKFSPSGKYLVSGSEDGKLIIYDVQDGFKVLKILESSESMDNFAFAPFSSSDTSDKASAVIYCAWDPTENYLVSCSLDTVVRVWAVSGLHVPNKRVTRSMDNGEPELKLMSCFTLGSEIRTWSVEFLPGHATPKFIVGSPDKVLKAYDVEGNELFDFYGNIDNTWDKKDAMDDDAKDNGERNFNRINDISITPNGKVLVTVNHDKHAHFYSIPDFSDPDATTKHLGSISLKGRLTSCSISCNGKYLLINSSPDELEVWNISGMYSEHRFEKPFLYKRLLGHTQDTYVIRSCFGYLVESTGEEELVLSGSDDGYVYYWNLHTGKLINRIKAHVGVCNSVDWNRMGKYTDMFDYGKLWCSVGDDHVVKIWGRA